MAFGIQVPGTPDSTKDGFTLIFTGMGETLTRLALGVTARGQWHDSPPAVPVPSERTGDDR